MKGCPVWRTENRAGLSEATATRARAGSRRGSSVSPRRRRQWRRRGRFAGRSTLCKRQSRCPGRPRLRELRPDNVLLTALSGRDSAAV